MIANIVLPDSLSVELLDLLKQLASTEGVEVSIVQEEPKRRGRKPRTMEPEVPEAQSAEPQEAIPDAWRQHLPAGTRTVEAIQPEPERNKVVYRVVDPTKQFNGQPEQIKCFLLASGPQSAKSIEKRLVMKQKAVESALWQLRDAGCVTSEQVSR